jgi:hypothetical protein
MAPKPQAGCGKYAEVEDFLYNPLPVVVSGTM